MQVTTEKKRSFLDSAVGEIRGAVNQLVPADTHPQDAEELFGLVKLHLIQSFKNGIQVGVKRAHQKPKQKDSTHEE